MVIYTIGHSTRSLDEFLELLRAHHIGRVADIRTVPRSRRHPHFAADALRISLPAIGVDTATFQGSGACANRDAIPGTARGGTKGSADTRTTWRPPNSARRLQIRSSGRRRVGRTSQVRPEYFAAGPERPGLHTVMMCAEAVWWRCHRQLTADALLARGVEVAHIMGTGAATAHKLTDFARVVDGEVRYPGLT